MPHVGYISGSIGSLSDTTLLTFDGESHTIREIALATYTRPDGRRMPILYVAFNRALPKMRGKPGRAHDNLVFRAGGVDFRLSRTSAAVKTFTTWSGYRFSALSFPDVADLNWSSGDSIDVSFVAPDKPLFVSNRAYHLVLDEDAPRSLGQPRKIGTARPPVRAIHPGGETVSYTLEGRDAALFTIDANTAVIRTKAELDYDYETETRSCPGYSPCYDVTVKATASGGTTATRRVIIELRDGDDGLDPHVTAPPGTSGVLKATWHRERDFSNRTLTGYKLRYENTVSGDDRLVAWWDPERRVFVTMLDPATESHVFNDLEPDTEYIVRVQSHYSNGSPGFWYTARARTGGTAQGAPPEPLTATFSDLPRGHGGEAFTLRLAFSEAFPVTADQVRAGLTLTGGSLTAVAPAVAGENGSWDLTVTPSAVADAVTVALTPKESCEAAGAICTADGRGLAEAVEAEVPGRAPTRVVSASVTSTPGANGTWDTGETVTATVAFNRDVAVQGPPNIKPTLGILLGGTRREAELTTTGSTDTFMFSHTVTAADDGATTAMIVADGITLNGTVIGDNEGNEAILTFSTTATSTTGAGPALSVADVMVTEGTGSTADFVVTLDPAATETVTVDYATSDGTATAEDDYTSTSGTLTFDAGETSKTVSVTVIDDTVEDNGETFTLTLSNPSGTDAHLADATAIGTINNDEGPATPLTASFSNVPASHDGDSAFTFRVAFSEEIGTSYKTLRDDSFTVAAGDVTGARRVDGRSDLWDVTVEPDSREAVTVTLPGERACGATGAVCTQGDDPAAPRQQPVGHGGGSAGGSGSHEHGGDGGAHHQRDGTGGREADGVGVGHLRRRRAGQRELQSPVDPRERRHSGLDGLQLHPDERRRGREDQGPGQLHRRRRQRGEPHQCSYRSRRSSAGAADGQL